MDPLPSATTRRTAITAAEVVVDPHVIEDADPATLSAILTQLSAASLAVAVKLVSAATPQAPATQPDKLLTAKEVAVVLNVSRDWLYKSPAAKSLRVSMGANVRFSQSRIVRYIARHGER